MEDNKVILNCEGCKFKIARVVGEINCGLKQDRWIGNRRMCLASNNLVGMYWIHEDEQETGQVRDLKTLRGKR